MADDHRAAEVAAREAARRARQKSEERSKAFRKKLGEGGARLARVGPQVEVYSVKGPKRERETGAGMTTMVSPLLDPRLSLTKRQRAVGRCYGAFVEMAISGGSSEFLREFVDGGGSGGGGATEKHLHMIRMVEVAHKAVRKMRAIRYPLGKPRGEKRVGKHKPVNALALLDLICLHGQGFTAVALGHQWIVEREVNGRAKMIVPDSQRKHLAEALRVILDAVDCSWEDHGYDIPLEFLSIEVE